MKGAYKSIRKGLWKSKGQLINLSQRIIWLDIIIRFEKMDSIRKGRNSAINLNRYPLRSIRKSTSWGNKTTLQVVEDQLTHRSLKRDNLWGLTLRLLLVRGRKHSRIQLWWNQRIETRWTIQKMHWIHREMEDWWVLEIERRLNSQVDSLKFTRDRSTLNAFSWTTQRVCFRRSQDCFWGWIWGITNHRRTLCKQAEDLSLALNLYKEYQEFI